MLAIHRELADRMLPARDREVLIARTTARAGAEYEWGVHAVVFGPSAGLDEGVLGALATAPADSPAFDPHTRLLVTAADELADHGRLTDATWRELAAVLDPAQLIELIVLCGWYRTLSTVITSLRLPLEPWAPRFPRSEQRAEERDQV